VFHSAKVGHGDGRCKWARGAISCRRVGIALGVLLPLAMPMKADSAGAPDCADPACWIVMRAEDANAAFMRGDMELWYALAGPISGDFTLMQPFGGAASHGFDGSPAHLERMSRYFQSGVATQELERVYASEEMIVLVLVERQTGEVGGLPKQDWSLRVTQVYQRRDNVWYLVHRHADPLTRNLDLRRAAALARGADLDNVETR